MPPPPPQPRPPAGSPPQMKLKALSGQGPDPRPRREAGPAALAVRASHTACPPLETAFKRFPFTNARNGARDEQGDGSGGSPHFAGHRQHPCPTPTAGTPWLRLGLPQAGRAGLPSGGSG